MKKILFAMLLFVGLFLSSLYGLEPISQSASCDVQKVQWGEGVDFVKTTASDKAVAVFAVAHPPTSSWSQLEEKLDKMISGLENDGHDETTVAVVCKLRGESGV